MRRRKGSAETWQYLQSLLRVERVGDTNTLFELGGHSLRLCKANRPLDAHVSRYTWRDSSVRSELVLDRIEKLRDSLLLERIAAGESKSRYYRDAASIPESRACGFWQVVRKERERDDRTAAFEQACITFLSRKPKVARSGYCKGSISTLSREDMAGSQMGSIRAPCIGSSAAALVY